MVLIVVLWLLVIFIILVTCMGQRGYVDIALARYVVGKTRAKYIAWSGLRYAAAQILRDSQDTEFAKFDIVGQCGFCLEDKSFAEELFKHIPLGNGYFDIKTAWTQEEPFSYYGISDEESKFNLNAVRPNNYKVLKFLIMDFGHDEEASETVAASVLDWIDTDDEVFNEPYGNEETAGDPEQCPVKNSHFESVQELHLVRGMTQEIFESLKDYVTIFPQKGPLAINFNTASTSLLRALARSFAGSPTNTALYDADNLVKKIIAYRRGTDGIAGTNDDRIVERLEMGLNSRENSIMLMMQNTYTKVSNFLRFGVRGVDEKSGAVFNVEVIISRENRKIVYWCRM